MRHSVINLDLLVKELLQSLASHLLDVFVLVLVCNLEVITAWLQLDADGLAKPLVVGGKGKLQRVGNVVVQHPFQVAVEISVDTLHVLQRNLLPEDHLVEGSDEEGVQETTVENGQSDYTSDEL